MTTPHTNGRHHNLLPSTALSPRQLEAVRLLVSGKTYVEAAAAMYLTLNSFKHHQRAGYRSLRCHNKMSAYLALKARGLLQEEA